MSRTLADARKEFIAAIGRDSAPAEATRLVAVLDALIDRSVAKPELLAFRTSDTASDTVSFERVGTKVTFWSARMTRGAGAKLELYPPTGRSLTEAERANVMQLLNEHSRELLEDGDRLRISFGALKNASARTAVLDMMDQLLEGTFQGTETPEETSDAASEMAV